MKILIVFLLLVNLYGCNERRPIVMRNLGKCIEVKAISTSFNDSAKIQVITEKGFYILTGYHSYEKGQDIIVNENIIVK